MDHIVVTSIVPPADYGWPIACHCDICKTTTIIYSPYAAKPTDGDYWLMQHTCVEDGDLGIRHNLMMWQNEQSCKKKIKFS
jgi:hypothetical protein